MIEGLLLAVLAIVMFGLVVATGRTLVSSLAGHALVFLDAGRHRLRLWLTGLIIATAFAFAICLWTLVLAVNPTIDALYVAIGAVALVALSTVVARYADFAVTTMTRSPARKACKLFATILSIWTHRPHPGRGSTPWTFGKSFALMLSGWTHRVTRFGGGTAYASSTVSGMRR